MAANMYRVGDYVYFETSSTTPYQIRRIEELNKTPNGNVEAKVMCFYRRRDISSSLTLLADKHQHSALEDEEETCDENISEKHRHQLKHRELFLSRQVETLPATHIRGKCVVTLLNETESLLSYLNKEDTFFYSLVYDPQQKTLLADKGEIRIGQRNQADVSQVDLLKEGESDGRKSDDLEELIWKPDNDMTDGQVDQFLILARSVGTFARSLDSTSTVRQPSLHMSAAAASRDITLFQTMNIIHKSGYDPTCTVAALVPPGGPVLCRDEMEEWSSSEANLFEEALDKYGKDFNDIRQDFLPWKSLKSIVEYYYMWKTTDRYVQQKRIKAAEAESKLKQVYIPNYNKPNPAALSGQMNGTDGQVLGRACESCYAAHSNQWYSWGPAHMQCRLCSSCWIYWKKYGGLKMPTRLGQLRLAELGSYVPNIKELPQATLDPVVARLGIDIKCDKPALLHRADGSKIPPRLLFPPNPTPAAPQAPPNVSLLSTYSAFGAAKIETAKFTPSAPSIMKKRGYETSNGLDAPNAKHPNMGVIRQVGAAMRPQPIRSGVMNHTSMNGRNKYMVKPIKMHMMTWIDAPDDVYFVATDATRKLRKQLLAPDFRRAARNPWRGVLNIQPPLIGNEQDIVVLD